MKKYITKEQAMYILPDGDSVHTFINSGIGLCGAAWDRESILEKIQKSDILELTGGIAKGMGHGLCSYNKDTVKLGDVLFIETDMKRLQEVEEMEGEPQKDHFREETKKIQTKIDREAWEPCEFCGEWIGGECTPKEDACYRMYAGFCKQVAVDDFWEDETEDLRYCPMCGRPLTDEAVEMVMERLEALYNE